MNDTGASHGQRRAALPAAATHSELTCISATGPMSAAAGGALQGHPASRKDYEMNDDVGGSRGRNWRGRLQRVMPVAAMTGIALLAAACGGGSSPAVAGTTAYQKAVAFAQCMRSHGEPGFPDPDSQGNFLINGRQAHLIGGSQMQSATRACQHLDPSTPMTPAQQRQAADRALKFVACMRSHGLPNMPDPVVNASGVSMRLPAGARPGSSQFKSAQQACRSLLPGLGGRP
jgi:hypothetical protein